MNKKMKRKVCNQADLLRLTVARLVLVCFNVRL